MLVGSQLSKELGKTSGRTSQIIGLPSSKKKTPKTVLAVQLSDPVLAMAVGLDITSTSAEKNQVFTPHKILPRKRLWIVVQLLSFHLRATERAWVKLSNGS